MVSKRMEDGGSTWLDVRSGCGGCGEWAAEMQRGQRGQRVRGWAGRIVRSIKDWEGSTWVNYVCRFVRRIVGTPEKEGFEIGRRLG